MKISEKQLLMLVDIAKDTLRIAGSVGGYTPHNRLQLVNDIMNQQSNDIRDIEAINTESMAKKQVLNG